jgi:UDP-N-acetylglucosamine--N-acetylmuramyl-(pentapeptide) pyrophosphoryl-undecaprenol N-acetylglucosamine transferase
MSARTPRIVIAAGGTGGHLFPGIAVAEALRARGVTELLFVSAGKGNWREALDKAGFAWKSLPVRGFGRRPSLAHLAFPFRLAAGIALSFALIASFRPAAVVGTGGYVSGPVVAAAWLLGVPVLLLEQNAFPGVSTRIASQFAREIHLAYPGSESFLPASARARARVTGNPIRGGVLRADRAGARAALGLAAEVPTLFLLGGSQGAIALNRALHEALARSAQERGPWTTGLQSSYKPSHTMSAIGTRSPPEPFVSSRSRSSTTSASRTPPPISSSAAPGRRRSPRSRRSVSPRFWCRIRSPLPIIRHTTPRRWRAQAPPWRFPKAT